MKKILGIFVATLAMFLLVKPTFAAIPNWTLNAPNTITFMCGGSPYYHTLNTVAENYGTGDFTGTGTWNNNTAYYWDINGNISGDNIVFTLVYLGANSGYTLHGTGIIAPDGSISGTTDGNCQTFSMPIETASSIYYALDWGSEVNPSKCPSRVGGPIINITEKVTNDSDSGFFSYWAQDNYNRQIQVWKMNEPGYYCAVVRYEGQFQAFPGAISPNASDVTLAGDERGTMLGGRVAIISGSLLTGSDWAKKGNVGEYNYGCNSVGDCSERFSWVGKYFDSSYTYTDLWWGWIYHGGDNGTWINAMSGSFGNIF